MTLVVATSTLPNLSTALPNPAHIMHEVRVHTTAILPTSPASTTKTMSLTVRMSTRGIAARAHAEQQCHTYPTLVKYAFSGTITIALETADWKQAAFCGRRR